MKESKRQFAQLAKETHDVTVRLIKSIIAKKRNLLPGKSIIVKKRNLLPVRPSESRIVPGTIKIRCILIILS